MRLRTALGLGALLLALAAPATGLGQRRLDRPYGHGYFGNGPFGPSSLYGDGYRTRYGRVTGPLRFGGATVYFGPGGGYGYQAPVFGYGYGYPYSYSSGLPFPLRYGY